MLRDFILISAHGGQQAFAPMLMEAGELGRVVLISSEAGLSSVWPFIGLYAISK